VFTAHHYPAPLLGDFVYSTITSTSGQHIFSIKQSIHSSPIARSRCPHRAGNAGNSLYVAKVNSRCISLIMSREISCIPLSQSSVLDALVLLPVSQSVSSNYAAPYH
jgi:hypothetical protein